MVLYCKGLDNGVADALSRRTHTDVLMVVSIVQHDWLSDVVAGYESDLAALAHNLTPGRLILLSRE